MATLVYIVLDAKGAPFDGHYDARRALDLARVSRGCVAALPLLVDYRTDRCGSYITGRVAGSSMVCTLDPGHPGAHRDAGTNTQWAAGSDRTADGG